MPKRAVARPRPRQTTTTVKVLFGGKVRLLRHNQNPMLYARAFLQGRYVAARTGETAVLRAQKIAEEWFWGLRETVKAGGRIHEPLFAELVDDFIKDPTLRHEVSAGQHANYEKKWSVLRPYFAHTNVRVSQVDAAFLEDLRLKRAD